MKIRTYKALALLSGGLDSMLAAKLVMQQGIHVVGINFFTGFTGDWPENISVPLLKKPDGKIVHNASWVAKQLGIKLHIINVVAEFKSVMVAPKYGFGANLNPCLDCKLFMIQQAKLWLEQHGFDFLVSGEVLGQRPMSQRKDSLPLACELTDDLILRPLSAKLLKPTVPEINGWINRELLENFNGRSRKPQIELAHKFGFHEFPQPAGGCVLTDENYCRRLQDLWLHRPHKDYSLDDLLLLRIGRHLRISSELKLIVGRDEIENNFIERYQDKFITLQSHSCAGAKILVDAIDPDLNLVAQIAAFFSKGRANERVEVLIRNSDVTTAIVAVTPMAENQLDKNWYV